MANASSAVAVLGAADKTQPQHDAPARPLRHHGQAVSDHIAAVVAGLQPLNTTVLLTAEFVHCRLSAERKSLDSTQVSKGTGGDCAHMRRLQFVVVRHRER
jgi:hypothetical protein